MTGERVLVTGGAGFIGSNLVDELVREGDEVIVLDSLEPQVHRGRPDYLNKAAEYHFVDVTRSEVVADLTRRVDVVVHLASMVGVGQSMYQVSRYVDSNVRGTATLLQALVTGQSRIRKLILASSNTVYGEGTYECARCGVVNPPLRSQNQLSRGDWEVHCSICGGITKPLPTPELKPLAPNSVYAITKRDQEEIGLMIGRTYRLPTVALRFFCVYGPRQSLDNPYTGVTAIFQSRIKNGRQPVVFEDGCQTRDLVSVHDVVHACRLAIEKDDADLEAINIGTGIPTTVMDVATTLLDLYNSPLKPATSYRSRCGDVRHCTADISKARRLLGYEPKVSFREGIRELIEWGQRQAAQDNFDRAYDELQRSGLLR
jgi:dTDP-L-rhamnose 4-epimerase